MNETFCPVCKEQNPDNAIYCCRCGKKLSELWQEQEKLNLIKHGEIPLLEKTIETENGSKVLRVICGDITKYKEDIDLLTVSSFRNNYSLVPGTLIESLFTEKQIDVDKLAEDPFIDCRKAGNCWISEPISDENIHRIGCVELSEITDSVNQKKDEDLLPILKTYFHLLDVADDLGIVLRHIASPMLGTGQQRIDENLVAIPLINEVISFLRRNQSVQSYTFFRRSYEKACKFVDLINNSYQIKGMEHYEHPSNNSNQKPYVFISYTTKGDGEAAEQIYRILSEKKIDCWFAPKDIRSGAYAEKIFNAINKCTHFICLISENSMKSEHVLNEIDLAFHRIKEGVEILPYRLYGKDNRMSPSFSYYLSRMQWHYGCTPPEERKAREFIDKIFGPNTSAQ